VKDRYIHSFSPGVSYLNSFLVRNWPPKLSCTRGVGFLAWILVLTSSVQVSFTHGWPMSGGPQFAIMLPGFVMNVRNLSTLYLSILSLSFSDQGKYTRQVWVFEHTLCIYVMNVCNLSTLYLSNFNQSFPDQGKQMSVGFWTHISHNVLLLSGVSPVQHVRPPAWRTYFWGNFCSSKEISGISTSDFSFSTFPCTLLGVGGLSRGLLLEQI